MVSGVVVTMIGVAVLSLRLTYTVKVGLKKNFELKIFVD